VVRDVVVYDGPEGRVSHLPVSYSRRDDYETHWELVLPGQAPRHYPNALGALLALGEAAGVAAMFVHRLPGSSYITCASQDCGGRCILSRGCGVEVFRRC
jgi:hypothetical protein